MPTLSVILITRNEEANLRDCLASLGRLPQQVVIVDTASTDGTIAIAQEFGATIAQPAEEFGRTAVNLLIDVLEQKLTLLPKVILPFELVLRGSTGPVKTSELVSDTPAVHLT